MRDQMFAYTDPLQLEQLQGFSSYANAVHLCATNSLRKGVELQYGHRRTDRRKPFLTGPILNVGHVIEELLKEWASAETQMLQYAHLSKLLREFPRDSKDKKRLRAFRLNQGAVLKTMRLLTEVGLHSAQLPTLTSEEAIFQELWCQMESHEDFIEIRERFTELEEPRKMRSELRSILGNILRDAKHLLPMHIDAVVLHGFYFITPIQHRVFSLMRKAGIQLVFLNLYDPRYEQTFESVSTFIKHWVPKDQWIISEIDSGKTGWGERFAGIFEGTGLDTNNLADNPPTLECYSEFQTFLKRFTKDLTDQEHKVAYYSPNHEPLNERLREYFPEKFSDRYFLSYPIGQFLFHLHRMWDEQEGSEGDIVVNERSLFECFASGWLEADGYNARSYMHVLRDILPYFSDCRSLTDWRKQAEQLQKIMKQAVLPFVKSNSIESENRRFHEMMENPLLRFAFLNIDADELHRVMCLMEKLFSMAEVLFKESDAGVSLADHFERLAFLMKERMQGSELLSEEKKLFVTLQDRLSHHPHHDEKFLVQDLAEAIALYLGGKFEERDGAVGKFEDLDATGFYQGYSIHVCGLDEQSLPYNGSVLPWPLSRKCLESMLDSEELQTILLREQYAPQITRYLFYTLLGRHNDVTLSWIKEWDGKELEESLYLMILQLDKREISDEIDTKPGNTTEPITVPTRTATAILAEYPPDAHAEYELCPRRFYFSFLAQKFGTYREEFHHQLLFGNLLKVAATMSSERDEQVFQQVAQLFPHWSDVKKLDVKENSFAFKSTVDTGYEPYEGRDYANARVSFQFLMDMESNISSALNHAFHSREASRSQHVQAMEADPELQMVAKPGWHCRICPHLPVCRDGHYPTDDKLRG